MSNNAAVAWRSEKWRKLTRRDLAGFDTHATDAVLTAMERGGVGRVSSKGHAILRSPNGATMSISPNSNRSQQVTAIRIRKLFPEAATTTGPEGSAQKPSPTNRTETSMTDQTVSSTAEIPCTNRRCDRAFATQGALYSHIHADHVVCTSPGCMASYDDNRGMTAHRRIVHEGHAPRRIHKERKAEAAEPRDWRREAGRKGAEARWAKARAQKEAEQATQDTATAPAKAPVGEHTPEPPTEPTEAVAALTPDPVVAEEMSRIDDVTPGEMEAVADRVKAVVGRMEQLADFDATVTEAIRRLDDWVAGERAKYEAQLTDRDARIAELEGELGDLKARMQLLREALQA